MQRLTYEITKEQYNKLQTMSYEEQRAELFPDGIPDSWRYGYGYYGHILSEVGGRYYVTHKIGESCD